MVEIGELVAIILATKIIAPNVWGWIADHSGRSMAIVRVACLLAALAFAGVFLVQGYWWLALVMMVDALEVANRRAASMIRCAGTPVIDSVVSCVN